MRLKVTNFDQLFVVSVHILNKKFDIFTGKQDGGPGKPKIDQSPPANKTVKCLTCNQPLPTRNIPVKPGGSITHAKPENTNTNTPTFDKSLNKETPFLFQLLQDSVNTTYQKLQKVHVELKNKLSESTDKCEKLTDEVNILQKKHEDDTKLIAEIEKQALLKYQTHSAEIKNYQSIINQLQDENDRLIKDTELLEFYKAQADKLCTENAALRTKVNVLSNQATDKLEVVSKTDSEVMLRPHGSKTRPKKYIAVESVVTPSADADLSLLKRRAKKLSDYLKMISCIQSKEYKEEDIVKTLAEFIKQNATLMNNACNEGKFSTLHGFSLKESADLKVLLGLSFTQYNSLNVALKKRNINILASETKVREELKSRISTIRGEIESGTIPLFVSKSAKKPENVAYCRIRDIRDSLSHTIRNHSISSDPRFGGKLWCVLGFDKGGPSTKLGYEIPNIDHSKVNWLGALNATDSRDNMEVAFGIYREQFKDLDSITVDNVDYELERFLNGDLKSLSDNCGHQGASASCPCLLCKLPLSKFRPSKVPHTPLLVDPYTRQYSVPNKKLAPELRTIEELEKDHASCLLDDRNPKTKGKFHHSIVRDMLFPVKSILNIVPAPLHLKLGLGDNFFDLTENAAIQMDKCKKSSHDTELLVNKWKELSNRVEEAENELENKKNEIGDLDMIDSGERQDYINSLGDLDRNFRKLSHELSVVHSQVENAMGPAQSQLYKSLEVMGVKKKAYHGGTLVGKHINKILANVEVLCSCLKGSKKYNDLIKLWNLFASCQKIIDAPRFLSDDEINMFRQKSCELGDHYSKKFPHANISRKFHIMVFHVYDFMQKWKTVGLLSEQKLEALHGTANKVERSFTGIRDQKRKLSLVFDTCNLIDTTDASLTQPKRRKCAECPGYLKVQTGLDIHMCQMCGKIYT